MRQTVIRASNIHYKYRLRHVVGVSSSTVSECPRRASLFRNPEKSIITHHIKGGKIRKLRQSATLIRYLYFSAARIYSFVPIIFSLSSKLVNSLLIFPLCPVCLITFNVRCMAVIAARCKSLGSITN